LNSDQQTKVNLAISELTAAGKPALAEAVENGDITIVSNLTPDHTGTNDHDTLAIDCDDLTPEATAVTLEHEFEHTQHSNAAGTEYDPTTSQLALYGICNHAQMYADASWLMCTLASSNPTMGCDEIEAMNFGAGAVLDQCVKAGGSCDCSVPDTAEGDCGCHD
jgi:hypothetical protein